jgi:hypothetical protein
MKKIFIYKEVLLTLAVFVLLLAPVAVYGDQTGSPSTGSGSAGAHVLQNPLGNNINSVCGLVIALLRAITIIGIPIAILFIVWAGFQFVLAQGNSTKLTVARNNFLYVLIGIGIFVGATLIANVIVNTLANLGVTGINSC